MIYLPTVPTFAVTMISSDNPCPANIFSADVRVISRHNYCFCPNGGNGSLFEVSHGYYCLIRLRAGSTLPRTRFEAPA